MRVVVALSLLFAGSALGAAAVTEPQRPIASIVSPVWSNEESRDRAGEAAQVTKLLKLGAGQTVADIGAGSGYYTVRLSPLVGPTGRVIAQDVMPDYLRAL